jgi:hypothetical protein
MGKSVQFSDFGCQLKRGGYQRSDISDQEEGGAVVGFQL